MAKISIVPGKGQHHKGCICTDNIDLQSGRCAITNDKDGNYVKENACDYCYAKYLFKKTKYEIKSSITTQYLLDEVNQRNNEKIKLNDTTKTVKTIRLGKMVDIWDTNNVEQSKETLLSVIYACTDLELPIMLMTKLLPFDEEVAIALMSNPDAVLHYSLGSDALEKGALIHNMSNDQRIEEAKKYKEFGCNVYLRLVADVVQPMTAEHYKIEQVGIPLLITPLRYTNKNLFINETKINWDEAEGHGYKFDRGAMRPLSIDSTWGDKYKHAYCGVVGEELGCNACGLYQGRKRWIKDN